MVAPAVQAGSGTATQTFIPGPILLMGAPGAGKGTQAKLLMERWSVPQISTGDLLREMQKDPQKSVSPLGQEICKVMNEGHLIPNELVEAIVLDRLRQPDTKRGYILDGFPRTLPQAVWLDEELSSEKDVLPIIAVNIQVSYTKLLRRITGRRVCPTCGRTYNIYFCLPEHETVCDVDGTGLVQRPDDTEEVFAERMRTYEAMTAPVIEHYHGMARFAEVNGDLPVGEITQAIVDAIVRLRG
ncbi:MAG TPA: nucleoside monophosphate kinase [Acidobacteriaceae bacterium]|nr:nucleoside monophosphate kinase [Terriglobia bacterium]HVC91298.1 nucleoside monophosphate kinase [Acidobacteriaceae bacterium]